MPTLFDVENLYTWDEGAVARQEYIETLELPFDLVADLLGEDSAFMVNTSIGVIDLDEPSSNTNPEIEISAADIGPFEQPPENDLGIAGELIAPPSVDDLENLL